MKALSKQVGGDHYKNLAIQPVQYIHANKLPFIEGCIVKYITRWRDKGGLADLEKVKHFVDLLIELETPQLKQLKPGFSDGELALKLLCPRHQEYYGQGTGCHQCKTETQNG